MKKLLTSILVAFSLLICNGLSAQETVKHVVQKGETLISIASNYGVTTKEIVALNPKAERFLFVGMELQIPSKTITKTAPVVKKESFTAVNEPVSTTGSFGADKTTTTVNSSYADAPYKDQPASVQTSTTAAHLTAGYNLSLEEKQEDASVWGVSVLLSVDEYLTDVFYVGLGGGLTFGGSKYEQDSYKATSTAYQLTFPIYFGITPIDGLDIDTGPSFNWLVGGGTKLFIDGEKVSESKYSDDKELKRFTPSWRVSVRLLNCLHVGVNIGLKKNSGTSMTFGFSF